jgi:methyl-accepting chemotaxis protein
MRLFRKTYFVNPRLQLPLILGANVLALISALLIATLSFYTQSHLQSYGSTLGLPPGHPFTEFLAQRQAEFDRLCLAVGIAQFAIFNATAIFLSHRIAGPLYRLQRHLEEIAAGKAPTDVKFRKGDFYQQLAEACNKLMARLRESPLKP